MEVLSDAGTPRIKSIEENEEDSDKEEDEVKVGDDPRAGSIHSVIPQLSVNYIKLSEKMLLQL